MLVDVFEVSCSPCEWEGATVNTKLLIASKIDEVEMGDAKDLLLSHVLTKRVISE